MGEGVHEEEEVWVKVCMRRKRYGEGMHEEEEVWVKVCMRRKRYG